MWWWGVRGNLWGVQVKCTVFRSKNGEGYVCSVCSSHKRVPERERSIFWQRMWCRRKAWYIVPAKEIAGMRSVSLGTLDEPV